MSPSIRVLVCLAAINLASAPAMAVTGVLTTPLGEGTVPGPGCEDGLILDDGSVEIGYGWVPSAVWGEYVQTYVPGLLSSVAPDSVCVCWTRTQTDSALDFEIVVYDGTVGSPNAGEVFSVPVSVSDVPRWPDTAFYEVSIPDGLPPLNGGAHHIGVRWNPSIDRFFFVCADQSPASDPVGGFFRDDRAEGEWTSFFDTTDPIFENHRALLVRVRSTQVAWIPTAGPVGLAVFVVVLAVGGWIVARR